MKFFDSQRKRPKDNRGLMGSLVFFVIGIIGMTLSCISVFNENKEVHCYTQNGNTEERTEIFIEAEIQKNENGELKLWQEESQYWGAVYEFYVYNDTLHNFYDYTLELTVPEGCYIDGDPWNGKFEQEGTTIKITPLADFMTDHILPDDKVKFGFVFYTPPEVTPETFLEENITYEISGRYSRKPFDSPLVIFFIVWTICGILACMAFSFSYRSIAFEGKKAEEKIDKYIKLCANFIDVRDEYTKRHSSHVAEYSRLIAQKLGFSEQEQKNIYYVGMLHDVGKVMISREILCKPSALTKSEWNEMKKHTTYGAEVLQDFNDISNIRAGVLYHHERYDGKGYMFGLSGEDIPLVARIICVADSYDAMATDRAYRAHLPDEVIISELEKNSGTQFDPKIAEIAIELIKDGAFNIS